MTHVLDNAKIALWRTPAYRASHGYLLTEQGRAAIADSVIVVLPRHSTTDFRVTQLTDQGRRWLALQRLSGDFS